MSLAAPSGISLRGLSVGGIGLLPAHAAVFTCSLVYVARRAPMRLLPHAQACAEPRGLEACVHAVEPEADLGELDGGAVEVDAVGLVDREVRLRSLEFELVALGVDGLAGLVLRRLQVALGKLRDRLVEEGAGAERGLADGEVEDVGRAACRASPRIGRRARGGP